MDDTLIGCIKQSEEVKGESSEIVKALRCGSHSKDICGGCGAHIHSTLCHKDICSIAADLIESLQAELSEAQRREKAAIADMEEMANEFDTCLGCQDWDGKLCNQNPVTAMPCWEWRGPQEAEKALKELK